jgi:hypothetical protein
MPRIYVFSRFEARGLLLIQTVAGPLGASLADAEQPKILAVLQLTQIVCGLTALGPFASAAVRSPYQNLPKANIALNA